ncbi:putative ferric-chelate reductase 1 homolog [Aplysia californica]|uniref:Ferric-chelate reductase 1 homolog n=1 Tax=Aplysia californica TaxID=6500 RepID=A0ABM1A5L8_APLCA|nr:putative ferric-chelate reductase 1 homolog [Aplysia californica]
MVNSASYGCLLAWIMIMAFVSVSDGFETGAPPNTCWTRYPKHGGRGTQTTICPYVIRLSSETYLPGQEITVTIEDPKQQRTFSGFQIAAFRSGSSEPGNTEEAVGRFTQVPEGKVRLFSCFPGYKNMATHINDHQVKTIVLKWRAPNINVGNLTFRTTIVADFETFWTREKKSLTVDRRVSAPVEGTTFAVYPLTSLVKSVDLTDCGETKGCLLYPRQCTGNNCIAAVSFQYRVATDDFFIEMYSDAAKNYVAVGFSADKKMGHEETISCVAQDGEMSIQQGWNPALYNERLLTRYLSDMEIRQADGRLECRFVLARKSYVYRIDGSATRLQYSNLTYDRDDPWYIQLAWGKSMPESNVISYHKEMPAVSDDKIVMKDIAVYRGSAFPVLVQAHVALMVVSWIFLSGIVTVLSRHYRNWMPRVRICATKVWFQLHRTLAVIMFIFTGIGVTVIFVHYGAVIRKTAIPHAYVGLAVTASVGVQVIAGFFRPGSDSKLRPLFNWGHRLLGQASHILAAATMFLGFDIDYITKDMRFFGFVALGVWIGVQLLWHLIFEVFRCRRKANSFDLNSQSVSNKGLGSDSSLSDILFVLYVISLAAVCVAVMLAFLLF